MDLNFLKHPKSPVGPEGNKKSAPPEKSKRKLLTPSGKGRDRGHVVAGGDDVNPLSVLYDDEIASNKEMGAAAEQYIGERLKLEGHSNVNVLGGNNKGFDIEYFDEHGNYCYVEVKSLPGKWKGSHVMMSNSQYQHAVTKGDNFSLYVVENATELKNAIVTKIANPAKHFTKLFLDSGWKEFGEKNSANNIPVEGEYYDIPLDDGSFITKQVVKVEKNGTLTSYYLEGEANRRLYKPHTIRRANKEWEN